MGPTDAFQVLGDDHDKVRRMLAELEHGPTATTGADEAQLRARRRSTVHLIIEESRHEAAEEQYFWPAVRDRVPDGGRLADQAVSQEQQGKAVLAALDQLEAWDDDFEQLLSTFIGAARDHIEFEESQVWPLLRQALSEEERQQLGERLEEAKALGPARPHPSTPPTPAVLKAARRPTAPTDQLRESMSRRGHR
jgi:hemerythrin-like domain-containing protein